MTEKILRAAAIYARIVDVVTPWLVLFALMALLWLLWAGRLCPCGGTP